MIWALDNSNNSEVLREQIMLPNGCYNIAIILGNGLETYLADKHYELKQGVYLASQVTSQSLTNIYPYSKLIMIQLPTWSLSYLTQLDLSNFKNEILQLKIAPNLLNHKRINNLKFLARVVSRFSQTVQQKPISFIHNVCNLIRDNSCSIKVSDIAAHFGISEKYLQTKFKENTGLTPKAYIKVLNFRRNIQQIYVNPKHKTTFNNTTGYFDQSHFIRTFKEIALTTPKKFNPSNVILPELH